MVISYINWHYHNVLNTGKTIMINKEEDKMDNAVPSWNSNFQHVWT
jgi:hypothetical protein